MRGLLRVVELFEARKPKGQAIITEVAGEVVGIETRVSSVLLFTPSSRPTIRANCPARSWWTR